MADATLTRLGRRHRVRHVAQAVGAARQAGIPSVSLDLLYDVPGGSLDAWMTTLDAALELAPGPPVAVRPDPGRSGRRRPDGRGRRPPADDRRGPPLARDARPAPGRGPGRGRVPPRRPSPGRRRLARLRDQQLGPARAREPPQPGVLGAAAVRGRRTGRPRLRRRHPALERGPPGRVPRGADPGRRLAAELPPGGSEALDAPTAAAERVILGLRHRPRHPGRGGPRAAPGRQLRLGHLRRTRRRDRGRPDRPRRPAAACSRTSSSRGSSARSRGDRPDRA